MTEARVRIQPRIQPDVLISLLFEKGDVRKYKFRDLFKIEEGRVKPTELLEELRKKGLLTYNVKLVDDLLYVIHISDTVDEYDVKILYDASDLMCYVRNMGRRATYYKLMSLDELGQTVIFKENGVAGLALVDMKADLMVPED